MLKKIYKFSKAFIIAILGWPLYFISSLFIKNKNKYVFGVHTQSFSGNVKALLLDKTFAQGSKKFFIYRSSTLKKQLAQLDDTIEYFYFLNPMGLWHTMTAGYYIYSSYISDINYWTSSRAIHFNVWHGTPLKKIEKDVTTGFYAIKNKYAYILHYIFPYLYQRPHKLLVSSSYEKRCFKTAFDVEDSVFVEAFPPRLNEVIEKIPHTPKDILLYTPTWRDDGSFSLYQHIDLTSFNTFLTQENLLLIVKPHPSDTSLHIDHSYSNITLADKVTDIYALLPSTKILITDYSSMMFEAMYSNIPVVLFCPDLMHYTQHSREFYTDIQSLPFTLTKTQKELQKNLKKIPQKQHSEIYAPYTNKIGNIL